MSYPVTFADHTNKLLYDELDQWGLLLYAKIGEKIIGTFRVNIGLLTDFPPELVQEYSMDRFQKFYKEKSNPKFALMSKVMVFKTYRNTPAFQLLSAESYRIFCNAQVQFCFGICNFYLLPLYEYYGYRRYIRNSTDPNYGSTVPYVLLIDDVQHLQAVRSPFFDMVCRTKIANDETAKWLYSEFPQATKFINSRLVTEEDLWDILYNYLGVTPNKAVPALHGLSETEVKKFLHRCGIIISCCADDSIVSFGDSCDELNILLSGKIQCSDIDNILQGQNFGEIGLLNRTKHISNIKAVTDADILVLSRHFFKNFTIIIQKLQQRFYTT